MAAAVSAATTCITVGICPTATSSRREVPIRVSFLHGTFLPVSLFAAVVGGHHQVAVGGELFDAGGPAVTDGGHLALHPGELQHAARVVLEQVALKGLPAPADAHHHVLVVQHLGRQAGLQVSLLMSFAGAEAFLPKN